MVCQHGVCFSLLRDRGRLSPSTSSLEPLSFFFWTRFAMSGPVCLRRSLLLLISVTRVNLYGPPVGLPESENLRRLGVRAAKLGAGKDYLQQYLNFPNLASTYRGRVLVANRVVDQPPAQHLKDKVETFFVIFQTAIICHFVFTGKNAFFLVMLTIFFSKTVIRSLRQCSLCSSGNHFAYRAMPKC